MKKLTKKSVLLGLIILVVLTTVSVFFISKNISKDSRELKQPSQEELQEKSKRINKVVSRKIREAMSQINPVNVYNSYMEKDFMDVDISSVRSRTIGASNPKHRIVAFMDFACGICKRASEELSARLKENKDRLSVTYVLFPLDKACNPKLAGKLSDYSCFSSKLALCAEKKAKLFEAMDHLYVNRPKDPSALDRDAFIDDMSNKLSLSDLKSCMASEWLRDRMAKENSIYEDISIPGTPFILLDGRQLGRVYRNADVFSSFLDYKESKE